MSMMQQIKELREKTGAGMMDVRNALTEANGDMQEAMNLLRQKGAATAEKKSARATGEGKVAANVSECGQQGALVEVNCETDFSANNERFLALVDAVSNAALSNASASSVEELLSSPNAEVGDLKTLLTDTVGAVKENMSVSRFTRYELSGKPGLVHAYIHAGGKIGVLIEGHTDSEAGSQNEAFVQLVKDAAMQIAAFGPEFINRDDVPAAIIDAETEIEMGKEDIQSKPEAIRPKIVSGRVEKNIAQRVLALQPFVKDSGKTVGELIEEVSKQVGETVRLSRFERYVLGEGSAEQNTEEEPAACSV